MIEEVLHPNNMMKALQSVVSNGGSAGVDGMGVKDLKAYYRENKTPLLSSLHSGTYLAQPILGIRIPKSNGKTRLLGVPTVLDRLLQQAVSQTIAVKFEPCFHANSYGFRPNKNAQQAVLKAKEYINAGYQHIVDMDLKSFFVEVDHCLLLQLLHNQIQCKATMRLIRKWLRSSICFCYK